MADVLERNHSSATGAGATGSASADTPARTPISFVLDDDSSIRHFLSLILHGSGIDTIEFSDSAAFKAEVAKQNPDLIFIDVGLESADAIETLIELGKRGYPGFVQLVSSRGSAVLEHVKSIGEQQKLQMLPALKKPFDTGAITKLTQDLALGHTAPVAARIGLDEARRNGWVEFWYQPKIDLRRKQLAGAELFARARHPQFGVLLPGAFMPGAPESEVIGLAEESLIGALKASQAFAQIGVNLRFSVNVSVNALVKISVGDIVRAHKPPGDHWPGLIIDINEEQIITDLGLAAELAKELEPFKVKLAIDDFGRGYSSLARLKELPFAELKLGRSFISDCGTDKVNAPLCKTVIDLAHNFGSATVAIGIEKAPDVVALVSMGCDYGQGFLLGQPMPPERFMSLLRQRASHGRPAASAH